MFLEKWTAHWSTPTHFYPQPSNSNGIFMEEWLSWLFKYLGVKECLQLSEATHTLQSGDNRLSLCRCLLHCWTERCFQLNYCQNTTWTPPFTAQGFCLMDSDLPGILTYDSVHSQDHCFTSLCCSYCYALNECFFCTDQNVNLIAEHLSFLPSSSSVDESGSGQPEGMDMVVCRAPGGEFYVEGETWNLDECTRCTCRKGRVLCDTEVCPPALCQTPIRNKDTCCHVCPGNRKKARVQGSRVNYRKRPGGVRSWDTGKRSMKLFSMCYQHVVLEGLACCTPSGSFMSGTQTHKETSQDRLGLHCDPQGRQQHMWTAFTQRSPLKVLHNSLS